MGVVSLIIFSISKNELKRCVEYDAFLTWDWDLIQPVLANRLSFEKNIKKSLFKNYVLFFLFTSI